MLKAFFTGDLDILHGYDKDTHQSFAAELVVAAGRIAEISLNKWSECFENIGTFYGNQPCVSKPTRFSLIF